VNWKTNVPFLYDVAITNKLTWPSLTVQWFPEVEIDQNDNQLHRLLIGTNTSGNEQNYLKIVEVCLPQSFDDSMDPTLVNNIRRT
jgi:histone-binding protein RBBP4